MDKISTTKEIVFLSKNDSLGILINAKANELFHLLNSFDATSLQTEAFFKEYFADHHLGKRLIFSIQNSAHILYHSIKKTGKDLDQLSIVDYGAGLGTLFMLGSMLSVKRFLYNDHLAEWKNNAQLICDALKIPVTGYIVGDIKEVLDYANTNGFAYDIVASRNVIEHIYNLPEFYTIIHLHNPNAIVFSTTTANFQNPAMRLKHIFYHRKIEKKYYRAERMNAIQTAYPNISGKDLKKLTTLTRGKALDDFIIAMQDFINHKPITKVPFLRSNTCDFKNGVWVEHLLSKKEYTQIITAAGFKIEYSSGFWDTNYSSHLMNALGKVLNKLINIIKNRSYIIAPFVNVVAYN